MTRAWRALVGLLATAALAAACTSDSPQPEDEPVAEATDDGMFGSSPDYETHQTQLVSTASDKDLPSLCEDLELALADRFWIHEGGGDNGWCAFLADDAKPSEASDRSSSGQGAAVPVRVHAWMEDSGTRVAYFDPAPLMVAVDSEDTALQERGVALSEGLLAAVAEATGGTPEFGDPYDATYTEIPSQLQAIDLAEALKATAEANGMRLIDEIGFEAAGKTLIFAVEGPDSALYEGLYETSPAVGVANPVQLHVFSGEEGSVISYFDPAPLFSAIGTEFTDVGFELSTILSNAAWEAAVPA
ncbi:hypothetical protein [Glycomyces tarimensis]